MKCQNCGNNNATFHYRANINGHRTEQHFCAECAENAGYRMDNFFGRSMFDPVFPGFSGGLFAPMSHSFFPSFDRFMTPVMTFPRVELVVKDDKETRREKVPVKMDAEMSRRRELNALKEQLNTAVRAEQYEKAAELRDRIREFEKRDE